jgi:uncharacterized protein YkwD
MKKWFGKIVLLALLTLIAFPGYASAKSQPQTPTPTPTPTVTPQPVVPTDTVTKDEAMLITLINQRRAKHHLAPVKLETCLMDAARAHSTEMATKKYFAHNSRSGESFFQRLQRYGYKRKGFHLWMVGEDIAWGTGLLSSPVAIVDAWMKSPPHRAVILTPQFREIGVGSALTTTTWKNLTNVTFYTLDLGRRK